MFSVDNLFGKQIPPMKLKFEIEELVYLKETCLDEKLFLLFKNGKGELRAIEAKSITKDNLSPGVKLKVKFKRKGCSGRIVEEVHY